MKKKQKVKRKRKPSAFRKAFRVHPPAPAFPVGLGSVASQSAPVPTWKPSGFRKFWDQLLHWTWWAFNLSIHLQLTRWEIYGQVLGLKLSASLDLNWLVPRAISHEFPLIPAFLVDRFHKFDEDINAPARIQGIGVRWLFFSLYWVRP